MNYKTIIYEKGDKVATITLNMPEKRNALNKLISEELFESLILSEDDPDVRAIILTASGNVFCSGGDLETFRDLGIRCIWGLKSNLVISIPLLPKYSSISICSRKGRPGRRNEFENRF